MSKFLKILVNLIVICAILVACALVVPPLVGVNTVMIDKTSIETNLPVGSVTYSKSVDVADIKTGDKVLVDNGTQTYAYIIKDMDATAGSYTVVDASDQKKETQTITLRNTAVKMVLTIPYIAYTAMALQSTEGLIIAGLAAVFLIILFVLAELWRKDGDEDEDEEDEDDEEDASVEEETDEEDEDDEKSSRQLRKEAKKAKKEAKRKAKMAEKGYDGEDGEDEDKTEEQPLVTTQSHAMPGSPEDVMQKTMASIAQGVAEATAIEEEQAPVEEAQTVAIPVEEVKKEMMQSEEHIQTEKAQEVPTAVLKEGEKILPSLKASELIAKATVNGDEPDIVEDEAAGITLLDYSKIL